MDDSPAEQKLRLRILFFVFLFFLLLTLLGYSEYPVLLVRTTDNGIPANIPILIGLGAGAGWMYWDLRDKK